MSFNDIVELEQKCLSYLDTFVPNNGRTLAKQIILDALKKDAVEQKMKDMRFRNTCVPVKTYEERAAEYYKKYDTVGEF